MPRSNFVFVEGHKAGLTEGDKKLHDRKVHAHAALVGWRRHEKFQRTVPIHSKHQRVKSATTKTTSKIVVNEVEVEEPDEPTALSIRHGAPAQNFQSHGISPRPGFGSFRTELYNVCPDGADQGALKVLDTYCYLVAPEYIRFTGLFEITNADGPLLELVAHKPFFHTLSAILTYLNEQLKRPDSKPSNRVLWHRGQALKHLADALQLSNNRADDVLLYTIVFLGLLERTLGNDAAHSVHAASLGQIIATQGGLQSVSSEITKIMLMTYDTVFCMQTGVLSVEGSTTSSPSSPAVSPPAADTYVDISRLPFGFQRLAEQGSLSNATLELLNRGVQLGFSSNSTIKMEDLIKRRTEIKRHNSLYESCPVLQEGDDPVFMVDKAVCLALVIFTYTAFGSARLGPTTFRAVRTELTRLMGVISVSMSSTAGEGPIKTWCWLLAVDAWRIGTTSPLLSPEGYELMSQLLQHCPRLLESWDHAQNIVDQFFWSVDLGSFWRRHWHQIARNRANPGT